MVSHRITIRVPKSLEEQLKNRSRVRGQTPSEVVRIALENYLGKRPEERSAYERAKAAGLIGCIRRAPADLSTSRRHFEGFGKGK